jgi:hypothetical protein
MEFQVFMKVGIIKMIIYHNKNGQIISTCVMLGSKNSSIAHGKFIWDAHKQAVEKLLTNPDMVYVTGDTSINGDYNGYYAEKNKFNKYINI